MNPIKKAISELKYTIPEAILIEAFRDKNINYRIPARSLDDQIMTKCIRPRVMMDANLVGGIEITIPLEGIQPEWADEYATVYTIPLERTGNRTIISVLSMGYMPYQANYNMSTTGMAYAAPMTMNSVTNAAQRIGDSVSIMPVISNHQIELIGHNTILIMEQYRMIYMYYLRCVVENDENLSNLHPRSYHAFSKLVKLAVQSFIYNELYLRIDQAYLQGGQELGAFKEIVSSYADAEELYQTHLREVWTKVAYMQDSKAHARLIRMAVNPGI